MTEIDVNNMDSDAQREYYIRMCTELQKESKELETAKLQKCSFCELFDYMVLLEARIKALKGLPLTGADKARVDTYNKEWYGVR